MALAPQFIILMKVTEVKLMTLLNKNQFKSFCDFSNERRLGVKLD
jgi:hypothetical protein